MHEMYLDRHLSLRKAYIKSENWPIDGLLNIENYEITWLNIFKFKIYSLPV